MKVFQLISFLSKNIIRYFFTFLLLFTFEKNATSQVTGYMGKTFNIHTDIASSLLLHGADAGVEWPPLRTVSLTVEGSIFNKNNYSEATVTPEKQASLHSKNIVFGIKFYSGRSSNPAPKGVFFQVLYGVGMVDFTGHTSYADNYLYGGQNFYNTYLHTIKMTNVPMNYLELAVGRQYIIKNKFVIESSVGLIFPMFNLSAYPEQIGEIANKYGSDIPLIPELAGHAPGFSMHVKAGYLLF